VSDVEHRSPRLIREAREEEFHDALGHAAPPPRGKDDPIGKRVVPGPEGPLEFLRDATL
jgi:hypothetical protein